MDSYSSRLKLNASLVGSLVNSTMDLCSLGLMQIHSVFRRVVNIKTPKGLISVVTPSIGKSASYIVTNRETDFLSFQIKAQDTAMFIDKCIVFNDYLTVDINYARVWDDIIDCNFRWKKSNISYENLKALKAALDRYAVPDSAWAKILKDKDFSGRIKKLSGHNPSEAVKGLMGFGIGLTPTGDDVLLGFLSIVNTCEDYRLVRNTFRDEIILSLKHTSDISASFLKMAASNHYHEYVQKVLYSLVYGMPEDVIQSVKKLLCLGATSGADIASGIYLGSSIC